jgi:hypothetical protein
MAYGHGSISLKSSNGELPLNNVLQFRSDSTGASTYQWKFGSMQFSTNQNPTVISTLSYVSQIVGGLGSFGATLPTTLSINSGDSTKTYNIAIAWV